MRKVAFWPLPFVVSTVLLTSCASYNPITEAPSNPAKATPVITWGQPAPITAGVPLGSAQLNAAANVPGTFSYAPVEGSVLAEGTHTLSATFTPTDSARYSTASATVNIVVNAAAGNPTLTTPFVYVSLAPAGPREGFPEAAPILGYSLDASGRLHPIPNFGPMQGFGGVVSGDYLFSGDPDGIHIDTYLIGSNGTLTKVQSAEDQEAIGCTCHLDGPFLADRTGTSLYALLYDENLGNLTQSFSIDPDTGALTYRSEVNNNPTSGSAFILQGFSGDGRYAFGTYDNIHSPNNQIGFLTRNSDGTLTGDPAVNAVVATPPPPTGMNYEESLIGTDTTNHVAAFLSSLDSSGNHTSLPLRLASFTIRANGTLTSTNTNDNMPTVSLAPGVVSPSPDGTLIAIDQPGGFQLFHFNGAAPLTAFTPIITTTEQIGQFAWDSHSHLYALSNRGTLYVFSITADGITQAQGSPYSISGAQGLMVQPK
jgi:hypothetical protein